MIQITNAVRIPDDANNWHPTDNLPGQTAARSERTSVWTSRRPHRTEADIRDAATANEIRSAGNPQQNASVSSKVPGTVLSIDESVVESEVEFQGKVIRVQLQRSIFPTAIKYGTAFFLELVEEDGVRKPKILPRTPDAQRHESLRAAARKIIESL